MKLTESHVIFECPAVATVRRELKISNFLASQKAKGTIANARILRNYLGQDGSKEKSLIERGKKLGKIIEKWLTETHEPLV